MSAWIPNKGPRDVHVPEDRHSKSSNRQHHPNTELHHHWTTSPNLFSHAAQSSGQRSQCFLNPSEPIQPCCWIPGLEQTTMHQNSSPTNENEPSPPICASPMNLTPADSGTRQLTHKRKQLEDLPDLATDLDACLCGFSAVLQDDSDHLNLEHCKMRVAKQNGIIFTALSGEVFQKVGFVRHACPRTMGAPSVVVSGVGL
ncbi:hypothetical protein DFH08DRAFT_819713 [Mycena albidolilacea]|uniref:Uncharacterized protein n=1 Tax=Mycena albidolilacea TaxID=1033008 RepID=A0AAD6ZEB2_9AGAR|nr:hypothetical protein DFH08DRAFT_819713 [Mycena albidolilacea]